MTDARAVASRILAIVLGATAAVVCAAPAWAAPTTEIVQGDVLRIVSVADWEAASDMLPGQTMQWDVTVSAEASDPGVIRVGVSASGDAAIVVDVRACAQEWDATGCSSGASELMAAWPVPRDGTETPLAEMTDSEVMHLRLEVRLERADPGTTQVRVHASGAGESVVVGPDGGLATTGLTPVVPWSLGVAAVLVGGGLTIAARTRRGSTAGEDAP